MDAPSSLQQYNSVYNHRHLYALVAALTFVVLGCLFVLSCASHTSAYAEDIDTDPVADEFQQEIERTAQEYEDAKAAVALAKQALEENRARVNELEQEIPLQQERSDSAARELYKIEQQSSGIVELLLSSDSYFDFLTNLEYVSRATDANISEINRLSAMKAEFDEKQSALKQAKRDADENADRASAALEAAQEARREAQRRAQEEARRQAEEAAAAAAASAESAASQEESNSDSADAASGSATGKEEGSASSGEAAGNEVGSAPDSGESETPAPEPPSDDGADWNSDQAAFISQWASRIDAYLEGSPMAGQGKTFASAAWTYGVDPRWSPAIAFTESSKGAYCFASHNAWGWGSASWGSWEEAIDAHVSGLARGYGYTISIDAAKKYCPPSWQSWYDRTLEQMNLI